MNFYDNMVSEVLTMFDYFKGLITDKKRTSRGVSVTVEVAGVGYILEVTERDFNDIHSDMNEPIKIFVHMTHREDAMSLYGFSNKESRDIFQILLSVSGVGAKMALALLNEFATCDLISLVVDGNSKELTRAKGVGPKLAQKIILELKDKLIKSELPTKITKFQQTPVLDDTISILLSLGYEEDEINDALTNILPIIQDPSNSEEIIRKALTSLSIN